MNDLTLAVALADIAAKADETHEPLHIKETAEQIKLDHPEADATSNEITEALGELAHNTALHTKPADEPAGDRNGNL